MRKDREQAVVLRQSGMTYSEIKKRLGVPMSTLSEWFKREGWSNTIATENAKKVLTGASMRLVVLNTVRSQRLKKVYEEARQDAFVDFQELKYHPLFLTAVTLYWAHGDKTSKHKVLLSSGNVRVIKIFQLFLSKICQTRNIKAQLLLLESEFGREMEIKQYWIEQSNVATGFFMKSMKINRKQPVTKPYYGVCNLIVNSAYLKNKILRWIELLAEDISQEKYLIENAGIV